MKKYKNSESSCEICIIRTEVDYTDALETRAITIIKAVNKMSTIWRLNINALSIAKPKYLYVYTCFQALTGNLPLKSMASI